jgi:hypothetical protein
MNTYNAKAYPFTIIKEAKENHTIYPYLRSVNGNKRMYCIGPNHGRSFLICKNDSGRSVISKGNGLSYSQFKFLNTTELNNDTWGLLLLQDAIRDFTIGEEIRKLGIKTNFMECVIELEKEINVVDTNTILKPVLLQYNVECPYRINDAAFMSNSQILHEVCKWEKMNDKGYDEAYMIAANVMIHNLRILHDHGILHNAIHSGNYTWALELLDFEISHTPNYPYTKEDYVRHVPTLMPREIIQTYEIINYIAWCLGEQIDYKKVDNLFKDYNYDIDKYKI